MGTNYNKQTLGTGYASTAQLQDSEDETAASFADALSRTASGAGSNAMQVDLDMNDNDILNIDYMQANSLRLDGVDVVPSELVEVANKLMINALDYVNGDGSDESVGLQAAIDAAGELGKLVFPKPPSEYVFSQTLNIPGGQSWQGEIDWVSTRTPTGSMSRLRYTGSTLALSCLEMQMTNIVLRGNTSTIVAINAGIGISASGNLRFEGVTITGFANDLDVVGGFYHVFTRCGFLHSNTCISFGAANNITFTSCRFVRFDFGVTVTGGAGMVTFRGCSVESFTSTFMNLLSGSTVSWSFSGSYLENYPNVAIATGLTDTYGTGMYDKARFGNVGRVVNIEKSLLSLKGISYLLNGTAREVVRSIGNRVILSADGGATVPNQTIALFAMTGDTDYFEQKDSFQFYDKEGVVWDTARQAGVTTVQIDEANLDGYYNYMDYEKSVVTTHQKFKSITIVNKGTASGSLCSDVEPIGEDVIALQSVGSGTILAGDSIKFGADETLYQVLSGSTDVSLGGTITISPALKVATAVGSTVTPQSGSYQVTPSDNGKHLEIYSAGYTNTSSISVYIADDLPTGFTCNVHQHYVHLINILPLAGTTTVIRAPKNNIAALIDRHTTANVIVRSSVDIELTGDLVETTNVVTSASTSVTPIISHAAQMLTLTSGSSTTVNLPSNATIPFPLGVKLQYNQGGAGAVSFAAGGGATVNSDVGLTLNGQYAEATALKTGTDTWLVYGNLKA